MALVWPVLWGMCVQNVLFIITVALWLYLHKWGAVKNSVLSNLKHWFQDFLAEENTCFLSLIQGSDLVIPTCLMFLGILDRRPSFSLIWVMLLLGSGEVLWMCVLLPRQKDRCD